MSEIVKELYHKSVEDMAIEHKDALYCSAWTWEKRFAELIVLECLNDFKSAVPSGQYEYIATNIKRKFEIT